VEQPQPRKTVGALLRPLAAVLCGGALLPASAALAGCGNPTQRAVIAVPAARRQGEGRPLKLLPPFELATPRDAVVRIVTDDATCTGTLIADDRVLTAHHCVSARDRKGHVLTHNKAPEEIQIELGGDYMSWAEVNVKAIVTPDCGYASGEGDIAILVLTRHLVGMPISGARLDSAPAPKDLVWVFGFGRCSLSPEGVQRRTRAVGEVCPEGPDHPEKCENEGIKSVFSDHFEARAAICPGDSGGPVYSTRGDLVGVVSASVMNGDPTHLDRTLFTRVDVWSQLFSAAHEISLGASPSELPPYGDCHVPPAKPPKP